MIVKDKGVSFQFFNIYILLYYKVYLSFKGKNNKTNENTLWQFILFISTIIF